MPNDERAIAGADNEGDLVTKSATAAPRRPLVDVNGAAEYLGTTTRHIRRLVSQRRIPHTKIGGLVRFE